VTPDDEEDEAMRARGKRRALIVGAAFAVVWLGIVLAGGEVGQSIGAATALGIRG
jgi:hypothetical protein